MKNLLFFQKIFLFAAVLPLVLILILPACTKKEPPEPFNTVTITPTYTPVNSFTITLTATPPDTATITETSTDTATPTVTPTVTETVTPTFTITITSTPLSDTIKTLSADDGMVFSSGAYNSSNGNSAVGDTDNDLAVQILLSYNLPAMTKVVSARLRIMLNWCQNDPFWNSNRPLQVEHIIPDFLPIDGTDYADYSTLTSIGALGNVCIAQSWYEMDVTSQVEDDRLNGRGKSRFRLYYDYISNSNGMYDAANFYMNENGPGTEPQLVIEHY